MAKSSKNRYITVIAILSTIVAVAFSASGGDKFDVVTKVDYEKVKGENMEKATFAAGCFWGVEANFAQLEGVIVTRVGYIGGQTENPTYEDICYKGTGHAEAVEVSYDSSKVNYEQLLGLFFELHDPTQLDRQGPDVGDQYRSAIFFHNETQQKLANQIIDKLTIDKKFQRPIVTTVVKTNTFYEAEEYHQKYYKKKGIAPTCGIRKN